MTIITAEQKILAVIAHISYFVGGIGFIVAPLAIFLLKSEDAFVVYHAKQALVAHLVILAFSVIVSLLCLVVVGVLMIPILAALWLVLIITSVIAAVKAMNGETYRYPFIQTFVDKLS